MTGGIFIELTLQNSGLTAEILTQAQSSGLAGGLTCARVVAQHRDLYEIITDSGARRARVKGSFLRESSLKQDFPTVGDFVTVMEQQNGDAVIHAVLPRKTAFSRNAGLTTSRPGEFQAAASNFDTVFIVTSLNGDLNVRRLERYLAVAWESGATPALLLTKADLLGEDVSEDELMLDIEAALPGVDILAVSAAAGKNMDALRGRMEPGKTYVFLGMSGVGKSTLINALAGEEVMAVSDTGAGNMARGRHTTTHRQMFLLPNGALVIDTPGMRTMSVEGAAAGVTAVFGDVEALGAACRFSDCTHRSEPGCAVREAIRRGTLDKARLADYRKLKRIEGFEDKKERISAARLKNFMTRQTSKKKYE